MKQKIILSIWIFAFLSIYTAHSQVDFCELSEPISCGFTESSNSSQFSFVDTYCNSTGLTGTERYFEFVPSSSGDYTFELSNFDGDLDMFLISSCFSPSGNDCIASSDGTSATAPDLFTVNLTSGSSYILIVDGDGGTVSTFTLEIECDRPFNCPVTSLLCGNNFSDNNTNSFQADTYCNGSNIGFSGPEQFFSFTPTITGNHRFSMSILDRLVDLDFFIMSSCDADACLADSDGATSNIADVVDINLTAGQEYIIVVDGENQGVSSFEMVVECPQELECDPISVECGETRLSNENGTSNIDTYCNGQYVNLSGPEIAVEFVAPQTGSYTFRLVGVASGQDLDAFALDGCDPDNCIATTDGSPGDPDVMTLSLAQNESILIIIDGDQGSISNFTLVVECDIDCDDVGFTLLDLQLNGESVCCYTLGYRNDANSSALRAIQVEISSPSTISYFNTLNGFSASVNASGSTLTATPNGASIPIGTSTFVEICFGNTAAPNKTMTSSFISQDGNELCPQSINLICNSAPKCIEIVEDSISCEDEQWCIKVRNITFPPFDLQGVELIRVTGGSINASPVIVPIPNRPLANGSVSDFICFDYENTTPGEDICATVVGHRSLDGRQTCCFEEETICREIPSCECCDDRAEFDSLVNLGLDIEFLEDCKVKFTSQFDSCHYFYTPPTWGDGTPVPTVIVPAEGMFMHTYEQSGTYDICVNVGESIGGLDNLEEECWNAQICVKVEVSCEPDPIPCCEDEAKFDSLVNIGFDLVVEDCKVKIGVPQFDSCHYILPSFNPLPGTSILWIPGPTKDFMYMYQFEDSIDYEFCALIYESDDGTLENACWQREICERVTIKCAQDTCPMIVNPMIIPDPEDPRSFQYCFDIDNSTNKTLAAVKLMDSTNMYLTNELPINVPPNSVGGRFCVPVFSPLSKNPYAVDFDYRIFDTDGTKCCLGDTIPEVCEPCVDNDFITLNASDEEEECCFEVDIDIDCPMTYDAIKVNTSGFTITVDPLLYNISFIISGGILIRPIGGGYFPQGTLTNLFQYCHDFGISQSFSVELRSNGQTLCEDKVESFCEKPCDPCDDDKFVEINKMDNCCFKLDFEIDCEDLYDSIKITLPPGVNLLSSNIIPPSLQQQIMGNMIVLTNSLGGPLAADTLQDAIEICYENLTGVNPVLILVEQYGNNNEALCRKILEDVCEEEKPCVEFIEGYPRVTCDNGIYYFNLGIINGLGGPGFIANQLAISVIGDPDIFANPNVVAGSWDYCDTIYQSVELVTNLTSSLDPGDVIRLKIDLHNTLQDSCCKEPIEVEVVMPDCPTSDPCEPDCSLIEEYMRVSRANGCSPYQEASVVRLSNGLRYYKLIGSDDFADGFTTELYLDCDGNEILKIESGGIAGDVFYTPPSPPIPLLGEREEFVIYTCDASDNGPICAQNLSRPGQFELFPNPVQGTLNIKNSLSREDVLSKAMLYDQYGTLMESMDVSESESVFRTDHLPVGIYLMIIRNSNGTLSQHRIIKH